MYTPALYSRTAIANVERSQTFPNEEDEEQEEVRQGFNPDMPKGGDPSAAHNMDSPFAVGDETEDSDQEGRDEVGQDQPWAHKDYGESSSSSSKKQNAEYGSFNEERSAWNDDGK